MRIFTVILIMVFCSLLYTHQNPERDTTDYLLWVGKSFLFVGLVLQVDGCGALLTGYSAYAYGSFKGNFWIAGTVIFSVGLFLTLVGIPMFIAGHYVKPGFGKEFFNYSF